MPSRALDAPQFLLRLAGQSVNGDVGDVPLGPEHDEFIDLKAVNQTAPPPACQRDLDASGSSPTSSRHSPRIRPRQSQPRPFTLDWW